MKTRINGLLLGMMGSFVFCAPSFAQDTGKTHNFSITPEISKYEYKEPGLMKLSGTMYGLSAEYLNNGGVGRIKGSVPIQLRGRFTYMYGKLDYDGHLQNIYTGERTPFKATNDKNYFFDTAFLGGVEFKLSEKLSISPYTGLGYRYLLDKKRKKDPYNYDYKREQTYYYLPIGADLKVPLSSGWSLAFNTEIDVLLRGENKSHVDGGLKFRQNSGYGWRLAAKVEKNLHSVGIFAEPFYRYWDIAKSNKDTGNSGASWLEPKNKTNEFGLRIGVTF